VSVGSLTGVKDHATLLYSVAELARRGRDVVVDLVGLDTSRGVVPALVRELGLEDRVRIHGFMTQSAARDVVRAADVMLVTSRHEAGPVAMLEAAAVGVPTVGTPVGHVLEWAPEAAVMVAFVQPEAFADALCRLLDGEEERLDLARNAQARALAVDADWTAGRFDQIYRELSERLA
jgi:glycosyltransferase involved in cell wall biosynthesis